MLAATVPAVPQPREGATCVCCTLRLWASPHLPGLGAGADPEEGAASTIHGGGGPSRSGVLWRRRLRWDGEAGVIGSGGVVHPDHLLVQNTNRAGE